MYIYIYRKINKVFIIIIIIIIIIIFNFTIRYINNTLPTCKNLVRWGLSSSTECSFCLNPESLLHVVAGCNSYLNRFSWRHDSVLNFIANFLRPMIFNNLYVDIPGFLNPSIVTGDKYRPDLLLTTKDNCLYILELTVGYETNLRNNIKRKQEKYKEVIKEQKKHFKSVEFINLSISALGVFDKESSAFLKMLNRLDVGETQGTLCSVFMTQNKFGLNIFHLLLNSSNARQFSERH